MFRIRTYNQIALRGLERFPRDRFEVASELSEPDALLLRSHPLGGADIPPTVKAVARAGAGVNNIDVAHCSAQGIPVFNTPGANANAVKELVLCGLFMSARRVHQGINHVKEVAAEHTPDSSPSLHTHTHTPPHPARTHIIIRTRTYVWSHDSKPS